MKLVDQIKAMEKELEGLDTLLEKMQCLAETFSPHEVFSQAAIDHVVANLNKAD